MTILERRPKIRRHGAVAAALLALLGLAWNAPDARAESRYLTSNAMRPASVECVISASKLQGIPVAIIFGFLKTEGGHVGQESANTDGSYDLGPMQINDHAWLSRIAGLHFGGNVNAARDAVRDDGCYNIHIGTWIFKQVLVEADGDYRRAVGYYNSHNPVHAARYVQRYSENLQQVLNVMNRSGR
jgi:soluble lytic murein transglycosylase-like protein